MNSNSVATDVNRVRSATLAKAAAATAAVLALGMVSASPANANRLAPDGAGTTTVGSSTDYMEIDEIVAMLKAQRAQFLIDHPRFLR